VTRLKLLLERYGKIQVKHGMLPRRALEKQVLLLEVTGQTPGASWRCNSRSAVSSIATKLWTAFVRWRSRFFYSR
jgi:hypothetical protein